MVTNGGGNKKNPKQRGPTKHPNTIHIPGAPITPKISLALHGPQIFRDPSQALAEITLGKKETKQQARPKTGAA